MAFIAFIGILGRLYQIPSYLIEMFSKTGDLVYDPFCGVGTTLVEAIRLGRKAIGVDVNPIATMVAQSKVTFFDQEELENLKSKVIRMLGEFSRLQSRTRAFCQSGTVGPMVP